MNTGFREPQKTPCSVRKEKTLGEVHLVRFQSFKIPYSLSFMNPTDGLDKMIESLRGQDKYDSSKVAHEKLLSKPLSKFRVPAMSSGLLLVKAHYITVLL